MIVAAIPTVYAGIHFRSRLEARWAAYFDLLQWPFEYEPIDLKRYIPDFLVGDLLVECKPSIGNDWEADAVSKIRSSGWPGRAVVLGSSMIHNHKPESLSPGVALGEDECWWSAYFARCKTCAFTLTWDGTCLRCGGEDVGNLSTSEHVYVLAQWRASGNVVQWRGSPTQ